MRGKSRAAVFQGTRVPFQALLDYLEGGRTLSEFLDDFPTTSQDAAVAARESESRPHGDAIRDATVMEGTEL